MILTDGEHVGVPLALASQMLRIRTPQVMIGHNLLHPVKRHLLRHTPLRSINRIVVHSERQVETILRTTALSPHQMAVVPYGVDTNYWYTPEDSVVEERHVVSAGREHRDYATLVAALPTAARVTIADHSPFTPAATRRDPDRWPSSVTRLAADYGQLRQLYAKAAVVVIPLLESHMPAGITTLLEAMSMGKPVVVSGTRELSGVVQDGVSGLVVPPGDVRALNAALSQLLDSTEMRADLGECAAQIARDRYDVRDYAAALAHHVSDAARLRRAPAGIR